MRITILTAILFAISLSRLNAAGPEYGPRRDSGKQGKAEMAWSDWQAPVGSYAQNDGQRSASRLSPRTRLLLGVLVPGLPQYLDGNRRSWAYFAVEGISIGALFALNSRGNSYSNRYKTVALQARGNFVYPGLRNNPTEDINMSAGGYGEYYEDLLKWASSGDFDNDPNQAGVQPETDPRTYNGHQWEIAKINNYTSTSGGLPVPASQTEADAALESYQQQVYHRELNWDWTGLEAENEQYHHLFDVSERAYRNRNKFVTILVANHLVSLIDVLISVRMNNSELVKSSGLTLGLELYAPEGLGSADVYPLLTVSRGF